MGKQTRFHPVSLNVIRGAAEYCGFRLGRIQQLSFDPKTETARYRVALLDMPGELRGISLGEMQISIEGCFSVDVDITRVWFDRAGKYIVGFTTCTSKEVAE